MEQHIISYFSGIIDMPQIMQLFGIPKEKEKEAKTILYNGEHDFFAVNCSNTITASEQAELSLIVNDTANKLTQLNK